METTQSAQHLKVNLKLTGKACRRCLAPLELAGDATICAACGGEHHRGCWDSSHGCATAGCMHAPLARLETPAVRPLAPGMMHCRNCRNEIADSALVCPLCGVITSPDGIYHGPKVNAPGAVASMVYGIIGLLFCGVVFGPIAIVKANKARSAIATNPTYGGGGYATAGLVLGIVDLVAFAGLFMARAGSQ